MTLYEPDFRFEVMRAHYVGRRATAQPSAAAQEAGIAAATASEGCSDNSGPFAASPVASEAGSGPLAASHVASEGGSGLLAASPAASEGGSGPRAGSPIASEGSSGSLAESPGSADLPSVEGSSRCSACTAAAEFAAVPGQARAGSDSSGGACGGPCGSPSGGPSAGTISDSAGSLVDPADADHQAQAVAPC
jgi:hypothetical protein